MNADVASKENYDGYMENSKITLRHFSSGMF